MNIVFLDIDGPLLPGKRKTMLELQPTHIEFDCSAVQYLRLLLEYSKAKVVLCTNWVLEYSFDTLKQIMERNRLILDYHPVYTTPRKTTAVSRRHHEILDWLDLHHESIHRFLVIDDNQNCEHITQGVIDRNLSVTGDWVPVDFEKGLSYQDFIQGCRVFDIDVDEVSV